MTDAERLDRIRRAVNAQPFFDFDTADVRFLLGIIDRQRAALEAVVTMADSLIDSEVCDHDVGLCWCQEREALRMGKAALGLTPLVVT